MEEWPQIKRWKDGLEGCGSGGDPPLGKGSGQRRNDPTGTDRRCGRGEGKGIDDLNGCGFGIGAIKQGEDLIEERLGVVDGHPSMKATEGCMIGGRSPESEADKPAGEEIGGQQVLKLAIGHGPIPRAEQFGPNEDGN